MDMFERGRAHHQAGHLQQAEDLYRQVLSVNPRHADSHHLLGVLALQARQPERALQCFDEAIKLQPKSAEYHNNRGNALRDRGDLGAAEASYRDALKLRGRFAEALYNLGTVLLMQGRAAEAESCGRKAVRTKPDAWDAQTLLGHALGLLGRYRDAEAHYRAALRLNPSLALVHNNLGQALSQLDRHSDAEACYRQALRLDPNFADAHNNLGCCLKELKRFGEAESSLREVLRLRPRDVNALANLADALGKQDRYGEAESCCRAAVELRPDFAAVHNTLGSILRALGRLAAAENSCRTALRLQPDLAFAHNNLGLVLLDLGRVADAATCFSEALRLRPDFPEAYANLAGVLTKLGQITAAEGCIRKAFDLRPNFVEAQLKQTQLLLAQHRYDEIIPLYRQILAGAPHSLPAWRDLLFTLPYIPDLDADTFSDLHRTFGRAMAEIAAKKPLTNDRSPDRRLRIGWLSSDFHDHPVGRNVELFFADRNSADFEAYCYADVRTPSPRTERFRRQSNAWRSISGLSDSAVAEAIRDDRIDVMVYLASHFDHNRPQVAAWRPAPVQISLHDAATSGLADMDYFIADRTTVPARPTETFAERALRLPNFYLHAAPQSSPPPGDPPCLVSRHATFGSFHNPMKLNPHVLALWARVLQRVPEARLRFKYLEMFASEELQNVIRRGVGKECADRVDFDPVHAPIGQHLALYNQVDIALDPFPFNGSTATFEALWMGVPVVTLAGTTVVGRTAASMLKKVGLDDLIATSAESYVAIAAKLAADQERILALRRELRDRVRRSSLCDGARTTRYLERALRAVWRKWCREASGTVAYN